MRKLRFEVDLNRKIQICRGWTVMLILTQILNSTVCCGAEEKSDNNASKQNVVYCKNRLSTSSVEELSDLESKESIKESCVQSGVCAQDEVPPLKYSLAHRLVVRAGRDIWESVKSIRGRNLRQNKVAFWDFVKNMAIIWPGQIFGALKTGEPLSLEKAISHPASLVEHIPITVLYHTLFMVWTQSDRGAGTTPHVEMPKPTNAREFLTAVAKAYTSGEELNKKGFQKFKQETAERFMGFASIIPLEVLHLSILTGLQVLLPEEAQRLLYGGTLLHIEGLPAAIADKAIFATVFGLYLAVKWSLISKPLDLRALPMAREWMSRSYLEALADGTHPRLGARVSHHLAFPLEMTYRYGNSLIDGLVVIWFFTVGAPEIRQDLSQWLHEAVIFLSQIPLG